MTKGSKLGWRCPENSADEWLGFNESGIEHFNGDPFSAIAREITQNTNDARRSGNPAFLEFKAIDVPRAQFPNLEDYVEILRNCRVAAEDESDKAIAFFDNALELVTNESISMLAIHDRNTTGIEGPCKRGTAYHTFMKATGRSKKSDSEASGSFGIGKNAPFAMSDLRTIFVATTYADTKGGLSQLIQGKAVLMSHETDDKLFTNSAYWGLKDTFDPVQEIDGEFPNWLARSMSIEDPTASLGTTIYIAGFKKRTNWDKIITAYIIQNFFAAIAQNDLIVEVGDYHIDSKSLDDIFTDHELIDSISEFPNQPDALKNSRRYYQCMSSADTIHETSQQLHLGKTGVGILIGEEFPKRVAFVRNGMLITDTLYRLQRFPGMKNFVSVVECQNKLGNQLLRRMEPPRHDDFQPERLAPDSDVRKGRAALKQLSEFVRKHLDSYARNPIEEKVNLSELSDLLGSDATGQDPTKEGEANPIGKIQISSRPKSPRSKGKRQETGQKGLGLGFENVGTGGSAEGSSTGGGGSPGGNGTSEGSGTGPNPGAENPDGRGQAGQDNGKKESPLSLMGVKGVKLGGNKRRVSFTVPADGKIRISFERVGVDANTPLQLHATSKGDLIGDAKIEVEVEKMVKQQLDVTFKGNFDGAVKVVANEI